MTLTAKVGPLTVADAKRLREIALVLSSIGRKIPQECYPRAIEDLEAMADRLDPEDKAGA